MTNHLFKAIQQSRADEDAREPRPMLRGIASLIYSDNRRRWLEPFFAYEQTEKTRLEKPIIGKGIEECIETQRRFNQLHGHHYQPPRTTESSPTNRPTESAPAQQEQENEQ